MGAEEGRSQQFPPSPCLSFPACTMEMEPRMECEQLSGGRTLEGCRMLEIMLLELICSQIKAAQSWGAAGMLLLCPALVTLRGTPWGQLAAAALSAPELETLTISLVQLPGRGRDPPNTFLPLLLLASPPNTTVGAGRDSRT